MIVEATFWVPPMMIFFPLQSTIKGENTTNVREKDTYGSKSKKLAPFVSTEIN